MFDDLTDEQLTELVTRLRTAAISLAVGEKVAEISYAGGARKFHPADAVKTEEFLNRVIAEQNRRSGCGSRGAIFPAGV